MEQENSHNQAGQKKGLSGNNMFVAIIACWLLFYLYMGFQGTSA